MTNRPLIVVTLLLTLQSCTWPLIPTNVPTERERDKAQRTVAEFADLEQLTPYFEEAVAYVSDLVRSLQATLVVRSGQEVFREMPIDQMMADLGVMLLAMQGGGAGHRGLLRQAAAEADLGITGVDYAVAETGSAVLLPRRHLSRLTSLLPPVHLAIVRAGDVLDRLEDLFSLRRLAYYQGAGDMGSYLNFITGPSRTADIEQTLVIGAHGPKEAHMLILG